MTNKSSIFLLLLFTGGIFPACKKEYSIENATVTTSNFTAVINGTPWAASQADEGAILLQGMLNITGISVDSQEISITLADTTLGVHALGPHTSSQAVFAFIDSSYTTNFSTNQGSDSTLAGGEVDLSEINTLTGTVSGTFSFKVYRSSDGAGRTIASGIFSNIPYTSTLPGSNPGDTVTATIDNTPFTSESIQASVQNGQLTILGSTTSATQSITLSFPTNASVGSHALTAIGVSPAYNAIYDFGGSNGGNTAAPANAGTINILANNASTSKVRGNFSFTTKDASSANNDHTITSGFFSIYYGK